jgi:RND family efflux transporter MFP subunit
MPYRNAFLVGSLLLLASALALIGCSGEPAHPPASTPAVEVAAVPLEKGVIEEIEFTGRTDAAETVDVRAMVGGYLVRVTFAEGVLVGKGDVLYEIDPRTYKANVDVAEAQVRLAEAQVEYTGADLARNRSLLPKGGSSVEEVQRSERSYQVALETVKAHQAEAEKQQLYLDFTKVTAPISGRISRTQYTEGNLIQGGAVGATQLTTIVSINPIFVYFDVDEPTVLRVQKLIREGKINYAKGEHMEKAYRALSTMGLLASPIHAPLLTYASLMPGKHFFDFYPVSMGLPTEKGTPHEGFIDFVNNRLDPSTGTLRARGVFDNTKQSFTPGLFVRVKVPVSDAREVLLVRDKAIVQVLDEKIVYVVDEKNQVGSRPVTLGPMHNGLRIIESGLKEGERVVVSGVQRVRDGVTVNPQDVKMTASTEEKDEG